MSERTAGQGSRAVVPITRQALGLNRGSIRLGGAAAPVDARARQAAPEIELVLGLVGGILADEVSIARRYSRKRRLGTSVPYAVIIVAPGRRRDSADIGSAES